MKNVPKTLSVMIFLAGIVWFLQGINILPGSYMMGDPQWTINGGVAMAVGISLFVWINRRK